MLNINKEIDARWKDLEEKEKEWSQLEKMVEEHTEKAKQKIKLDIGGKRFNTSKATLLRFPNTYFHAMLFNGIWEQDEDGTYLDCSCNYNLIIEEEYFIDRNPKYFDRILDYFRTGEFSVEGLDETAIKKLTTDFDYFQIKLPEQLLVPIVPHIL